MNCSSKKNIITRVKFIEVIPLSGYQEKVYDQLVVSELLNKEKINLFDPYMLCTNDMVGEYKDVEISVLTGPGGNYKICGEEEKIGIFHLEEYKRYDIYGHDICGIVEDIDSEYLIFNIGVGRIEVENYFPKDFKFSIGDRIKKKRARLDLRKIW